MTNVASTTTLSTTAITTSMTTSSSTQASHTRVSAREQNPGAQADAQTTDGCMKISTDQPWGALARSPALTPALETLRRGLLVVIKLTVWAVG